VLHYDKLTWKVGFNGTIYFGSSGSKLRRVLSITDASTHSHHLIPWAQRNNFLVQKAAKSKNAFHMNEGLNGIPRSNSLHLTGHSSYSNKIQEILFTYNQANPNLPIDDSYDFIKGLANHVRDVMEANPGLNSGQIADLILYP